MAKGHKPGCKNLCAEYEKVLGERDRALAERDLAREALVESMREIAAKRRLIKELNHVISQRKEAEDG